MGFANRGKEEDAKGMKKADRTIRDAKKRAQIQIKISVDLQNTITRR